MGDRPAYRPGFWSGEQLHQRLNEIVKAPTTADTSRIDKASYILTVGAEIFITPAEASEPKYRTKRVLQDRESVEIPPGQFALLTTEEWIRVPPDAIAFVSSRSKATKFRGLVNVSGFYADPGYEGRLVFGMFNAGPASIHIARGDPWFCIFFASLDRKSAPDHVRSAKDGYDGLPSDHITPIANELMSFKGLDAKIKTNREDVEKRLQILERDNAIMRWATALILTLLLGFVARSCLPAGPV